MFVTYFSGPRAIFKSSRVSCFFLSQYLILCFKNNTVSASSTSKTSTGMVSSRTQPVSTREYMARNNKLQRHLADLLKQQSAKKETIPKLQQRYEGIQK